MVCGRTSNPSLSGTLKKAKRGCRQKSQYFLTTDTSFSFVFQIRKDFYRCRCSSSPLSHCFFNSAATNSLEVALDARCNSWKSQARRLVPTRYSMHHWYTLFTDCKFRKLCRYQFLLVSNLYPPLQFNLSQTHSQGTVSITFWLPSYRKIVSLSESWEFLSWNKIK